MFFFLVFFIDIGVVSLDFLADDCKISRLYFFGRSPARYGGIKLRFGFFTADVIVLVSKKLISPVSVLYLGYSQPLLCV